MQRMAHVEELVRRMGLAAILAMDDGVGRIREKLKDMGVHDNTLIFFMSDNGEPLREGAYVGSLNHPLALTGDRHSARYAPDGRLVVAFQPLRPRTGRTWGQMIDSHFTAWVGRYEDIPERREGQDAAKRASPLSCAWSSIDSIPSTTSPGASPNRASRNVMMSC